MEKNLLIINFLNRIHNKKNNQKSSFLTAFIKYLQHKYIFLLIYSASRVVKNYLASSIRASEVFLFFFLIVNFISQNTVSIKLKAGVPGQLNISLTPSLYKFMSE